jgi:hypothetical protein
VLEIASLVFQWFAINKENLHEDCFFNSHGDFLFCGCKVANIFPYTIEGIKKFG